MTLNSENKVLSPDLLFCGSSVEELHYKQLCITIEKLLTGQSDYKIIYLWERPINPFLPTGQFMDPKLIILMKCLIDYFIFQSVVLMFLYVEQDKT